MTKKRGLAVGGAVVVLALAIIVVLVSGESGAPEKTPAKGAVIATASARSTQPSSLELPPGGEAGRRLPAGADAFPPLVDAGEHPGGAAREDERPIVARGCVRWAGGTLPEDIDVMLYGADGSVLDLTTTAKDGTFKLRWDEPLARGWSVGADTVMLASNGTLVALAPDSVGNLPLHLPGDPTVEVELVLGFPPVITGRVFDRATGAAIESAEIAAGSAQRAWALNECSALSQKDGSYHLELDDVPLRRLIVWCRLNGWQAQLVGPQDIQLARTPGEGLRIDFALDRPVPWRGRVGSALDGLPVSGATITVGNDLEAFSHSWNFEISDEDGCFELELSDVPIEGAWVHAAARDFAPVALRGVEPGHDLCIVMGPPVALVGTVTTRGGEQPVEGATVQIAFDGETFRCDNGLYDEAFTDAEGVFEVGLESAPGDAARIKVEAPGHVSFEAKLSDVVEFAGPGRRMVKVELTASP